ncbi:MAG: diguanylate cyclase, partial [Nitrosomonas sp.]|nr:diguanylate cyclase [Nitrosomonas sp.]
MTVLVYQDFLQQASRQLNSAHPTGLRSAVLIVNFERLAELDGVLGFTVVDDILQQIAGQLKNALNPQDLTGITGRYQLCCLLTGLLTDAHAMLAAHKIIRILAQPFAFGRRNIILAPRIGVALPDESNR